MRKTPLEKEWQAFLKKEQQFITSKQQSSVNVYSALDKYIPTKLQETLNLAFFKGFQTIFEKGDCVLNKILSEQQHTDEYRANEYSVFANQNKKNIKAFSKKANHTNSGNMLLSGVEGVGLGLLGIGLPDIPIFIGMILKSIYQIAIDFGFEYSTPRERIFILRVIEASLLSGESFLQLNSKIDRIIQQDEAKPTEQDFEEQIRYTADALSQELLYAKFVQGLPIVGAVGGMSNIGCMYKITKYASLKYNKRFLKRKEIINTL